MKCPNCNEEITKVVDWHIGSVPTTMDIESGEYEDIKQEEIILGEHESYSCPLCRGVISSELI